MPATTITCPNCRQPYQANIEQLIDVSLDPSAKSRLLSGRLNVAQCPYCGFAAPLATPIAYHDADKQLLVIHVPMELNLPKEEMERVIGSFTTAVQSSLPQEKRKGYLFTPKQAFTRQSLTDIILEADGVTQEMIAAQREKMKLVEQILSTAPEELPALVQQYDDQLDAEFFALMLAAAESGLASGREDIAQAVVAIREQLIGLSTFGQQALASQDRQQGLIQEVADRFNALGQGATRESVIALILQLAAEDDDKLQVAVGLARAALDREFFDLLDTRVSQARTDEERTQIEAVRKRLIALTSVIDQQNEVVIRRATDTLRGLLAAPDLDAAIEQRIELFDDTFLAVMQANIDAAEQARDIASAARFKTIFEKIIIALQASAPPAIQFINDLMTLPSFEDAKAMIDSQAHQFGLELLQWIDVLMEDLAAQPGNPALDRLGRLRDEAERALANPAPATDNDAPRSPLNMRELPPPSGPRLLSREQPNQPEPTDPPPANRPIIELPSFRRGPRRDRD